MTRKLPFRNFFRNNGALMGTILIALVGFWLIVLIILPQLSMLDYSFRPNLPPAEVGGPKDVFTLKNYYHLIYGSDVTHQTYNTVDLMVFVRTILAAMAVTFFDMVLCYPLAYFLGQARGLGIARLFVVLLIIPYWVNEILRAFAFRIIFGSNGILNVVLMNLHVITSPYDFIRNNVALYAGLGYAYILLMLFPMYNVIESLDRNQIEAARDMGASWPHIHRRIVMPHAKPGIVSGATMVFMLTAGALATPQILGGPSSLWFTQLVYQWFNESLNWHEGAAYAIVLLVSTIIIVLALMRVFRVNMGEIGR